MFDERKAAQAAAYLLSKSNGRMPVLKLMKLLYLADRRSVELYGDQITCDFMVSMPHGPVLSRTLDLISGAADSIDAGWDHWIRDRQDHCVSLRREAGRDSLEDLSDADVEVLDEVWARFGHMTKYQLRDWTHDKRNCPEWNDPAGSSRPIEYESLLAALAKPEHERAVLVERREAKEGVLRQLKAG